jgi:hypothetical protein
MFRKTKTNERKLTRNAKVKELSLDDVSLVSGGECQLVSISCNYSNGVATTCERTYVCTSSK